MDHHVISVLLQLDLKVNSQLLLQKFYPPGNESIFHLGKGKSSSKVPWEKDTLVPGRVTMGDVVSSSYLQIGGCFKTRTLVGLCQWHG